MQEDPTKRFTDRASYYAKYRPRYPQAILGFMDQEMGLSDTSIVADIGSGTGILSELFLKHGNTVFAVEPNQEMRKAAEEAFAKNPKFRSVEGAAEATTLPASSVDFVTAAQAFHWFNPEKTRIEFMRIIRHPGWVALIWNIRKNSTPLMQAYDQLVRKYAMPGSQSPSPDASNPNSRSVKHDIRDEGITNFLGKHEMETFTNDQVLDYEGFAGRLLSSSYVPLQDDPRHGPMLDELHRIFDTYQERGTVRLEYETELYYGQLSS